MEREREILKQVSFLGVERWREILKQVSFVGLEWRETGFTKTS